MKANITVDIPDDIKVDEPVNITGRVTDADGKKVKDDNGEYETAVQGFIGQIEANGVVEDYAYYFTLPSGWKTVGNGGEFENKLKKVKSYKFFKYNIYKFKKNL